jgi:hypothetical protein
MATSNVYTATINGAVVNSASNLPIASLMAGASNRLAVVGVRIGITATAYASGTALFQLALLNNTPAASSNGGTVVSNDQGNTGSALSTFLGVTAQANWSTAPTTAGSAVFWAQVLPSSAGSSWEEFVPLGYEYFLLKSTGVGLFVTASGTAASQTYEAQIVWSE